MRVTTKQSKFSWVVFIIVKSFLFQASTLLVLSSYKAIVFPKVSQMKPRWIGVQAGSKLVFTQFIDEPQYMNTKAITWIWKITLHLHLAWFVK